MAERSPILPNVRVLDFVGLTPDKLAQFEQEGLEKERQERQQLLEALGKDKEAGIDLYNQHKKDLESCSRFRDGAPRPITLPDDTMIEFRSVFTIDQIPDAISRKWSDIKLRSPFETDQELTTKTESYINDLIEGFGKKAFEEKDWPSAVNAFDVATEEGVLQSSRLKELIDSLPIERDNHQDRRDIARVIQNRLDKKERQATQQKKARARAAKDQRHRARTPS
ncbi:MAG: hypothetical protein UU05_C0049G0005 [Candidatus Curtissbacteria bacterium GW2011_GWA1_40_47]|uniref:Uncharacterized protein n=1 Tax=Candidatus Curtissbacteria bacterium RIFOXYA1_FULL_41_14 TaxID=1797737 RepID=A0A1F5HBB7_9BACT|nr:MAG: hypothetical protein UT95_C0059G0003 [Candidatus Curtissbacteria bacterium GW2011_GWB1_40_28]KKR59176.1 MAG: hypothetical protein UT99_C0031G0007 [Candidatus Curtissbacteria bacterium GW2011_GWA2_40_31]KKR59903.1 MAG: hypothetical protein UU00_C0041G0003 [Microgenomates group bacterium GW2011_GWC1_40_35]KKR64556.1 MAG: hypothetical protein UU05_C0049G0005 [Candidatus Curtissbacteria bacterium GW2011_GWA1_40_47]KKS00187.1 MAG: hypothetical protein UU53_C0042G0007 [Candidatus Curtissbacte